MTVSTVTKLAEAHEKGLEKKRTQLAELDREIEDLTAAERVAMADWIRVNPSKSPDATSQIGRYRSKIANAVARRERLAKEVATQEQLLEELDSQANAEREAVVAKAKATEITQAIEDLSEQWAAFCKAAESVEAAWEGLVMLAHRLDALPGGEARNGLLPTSIARGFEMALSVAGQEPFASTPRITCRRLPTTGGSAATNTTGFSGSLSQLGDW